MQSARCSYRIASLLTARARWTCAATVVSRISSSKTTARAGAVQLAGLGKGVLKDVQGSRKEEWTYCVRSVL